MAFVAQRSRLLFRWGLVVGFVFFSVVALEFWEHQFDNRERTSFDIFEVFVVGIAFPLLVSLFASQLAQSSLRRTSNMARATSQASENGAIRKRVMVVENQLLLGGGLEKILAQEKRLEVVGSMTKDETVLFSQIRQLKPEILVLDESTYLTNPAKLFAVLMDYPAFRVLVVSAEQDLVQIYEKNSVPVMGVDNLIQMILGGSSPAGM